MFPRIGGFYPTNHRILIGFSIVNHPFWGVITPIFGNTQMLAKIKQEKRWGRVDFFEAFAFFGGVGRIQQEMLLGGCV